MKILITARTPTMEGEVDPRFGRAAWFVVIDTETGEFRGVDNDQNLNALQGAGIQAAQHALDQGVEAILTGHCGPKAFRVLSQAGIAVYTGVDGSVAEALERFRSGTLSPIARPDVDGHWQ